MGSFYKVIACYKQVRASTFFLSNHWYSVFVVYFNKFLVSLKSFQKISGVIKWNMLKFMAIVKNTLYGTDRKMYCCIIFGNKICLN